MAGDAAATRRRILDAAIAEFSRVGIAGARIDRIAEASGSNKAMLYKYYGNKLALFDAVFDAVVVRTVSDVPIDAHDLPEYAARLWDQHRAHIEPLRIGEWDWLERGGAGMQTEAVRAATQEKVDAIADAQRRGVVDSTLSAEILLGHIIALSRTSVTTELDSDAVVTQRAGIKIATARLTAPPRSGAASHRRVSSSGRSSR